MEPLVDYSGSNFKTLPDIKPENEIITVTDKQISWLVTT